MLVSLYIPINRPTICRMQTTWITRSLDKRKFNHSSSSEELQHYVTGWSTTYDCLQVASRASSTALVEMTWVKESIYWPSIHYQLTDGSPASTGRKTAADLSSKYACNAWSARNIEMSRIGSSAPQVSDVTSFFISEHNSTCTSLHARREHWQYKKL